MLRDSKKLKKGNKKRRTLPKLRISKKHKDMLLGPATDRDNFSS